MAAPLDWWDVPTTDWLTKYRLMALEGLDKGLDPVSVGDFVQNAVEELFPDADDDCNPMVRELIMCHVNDMLLDRAKVIIARIKKRLAERTEPLPSPDEEPPPRE